VQTDTSGGSSTHSAGQCAPRNGFRPSGDGHTTAMIRTKQWARAPQRWALRCLVVTIALNNAFAMIHP
jgi:hypothetical protein